MQTHGGPEANTAILAPERSMRWEIMVDWYRNGGFNHPMSDLSDFVDNIVVDRALAGAVPSEIMLVEGAAAAELSFEVGGFLPIGFFGPVALTEPMNLVSVFSPFNGLSPLYNVDPMGCEITYRIGVDTAFGTVYYPQFVGNIRTISPNRRDNRVTITALDRVEKLRKPITHTDWGILDLQANQGRVSGQLMHAHWMIDHCLKACDVSASPNRWPFDEEIRPPGFPNSRTQLFVSGNGGIAPNVGWVDGSRFNQFPDTDTYPAFLMYQDRGESNSLNIETTKRPHILRAQRDYGNDRTNFWAADKNSVLNASSHVISFRLATEDYAGNRWFQTMPDSKILSLGAKNDRTLEVWVGSGQMWLRYSDLATSGVWTTAKIAIPITSPFVTCTALLNYNVTEQIQLTVGSTVGAVVSCQNVRGWLTSPEVGLIQLWRKLSLQDISYTSHDYNNPPATALKGAKYGAVLDRSLNRLSFLPKRWGALSWDVITEIAAAEFGAVFWDENGVFRFWNQDTILSKKDQFVRTFNLDDVSGLEITNSTDSIRNIFSVKAKKARVQEGRVFEASGPDELYVAPGQTVEVQIWVDDIVTPNSGQPPTYEPPEFNSPLPKWNDSVNFGVMAQLFQGGIWTQISPASPWYGFMYRNADGSTMLKLYNGYGDPVRFADLNSGAAFRWDGSKMTQFDDQVFTIRDETSVSRWGPQGLELSSDWYQEFFSYGSFFNKMIARTARPIPATQNIEVAGDPRLQLGDAVKISDPGGLGEEMRLQILGISRRFSRDGGLVDSYTVEMTEPPRIGIWDSGQYGLWDSSFIWS